MIIIDDLARVFLLSDAWIDLSNHVVGRAPCIVFVAVQSQSLAQITIIVLDDLVLAFLFCSKWIDLLFQPRRWKSFMVVCGSQVCKHQACINCMTIITILDDL